MRIPAILVCVVVLLAGVRTVGADEVVCTVHGSSGIAIWLGGVDDSEVASNAIRRAAVGIQLESTDPAGPPTRTRRPSWYASIHQPSTFSS
jgi:hypothetical protein